MKANEALEKIYVHVKDGKTLNTWNSVWIGINDIEYVRKDAFIEKALKFLNEKFYFNNLHYAVENNTFNCMEEMFDDFKKYMED